jgi:hypothetical protein
MRNLDAKFGCEIWMQFCENLYAVLCGILYAILYAILYVICMLFLYGVIKRDIRGSNGPHMDVAQDTSRDW